MGRFEFRASLLPSVVTTALLMILVGLGVWQLNRAAEKQRLHQDFARRGQDAPVTLNTTSTDTQALRFRAVVVDGVMNNEQQFLLDNRTHQGAVGYQVLTPMRLAETTTAVIVNRGWVPMGPSREQLPALTSVDKPVRIRGIVSVPHSDSFLLGPAGYENGDWPRVVQHVDIEAMASAIGLRLLPFTVLMGDEQPHGFVREWRPYYGLGPERHHGYAFQWFALALALMIIYFGVNTRRVDGA